MKFLEQDKDLLSLIPISGVNDWLVNHTKDRQTFDKWNSMSSKNVVDCRRLHGMHVTSKQLLCMRGWPGGYGGTFLSTMEL